MYIAVSGATMLWVGIGIGIGRILASKDGAVTGNCCSEVPIETFL